MLPRSFQVIRLSQLREQSSVDTPIGQVSTPSRGWIRAVREALGLSLAVVGQRLHQTPQAIANLERSENRRAIRLSDLDRVADVMGCRVVYAFLPKSGRWEDEASAAAHHTMALEGQGIRKEGNPAS